MLWIALAPPPLPEAEADRVWWALGFSPRVCRLDEAVLLEVQASERLFGGRRALLQRVRQQAGQQGVPALACAPTALGALALMRQALQGGVPATGCGPRALRLRLDGLPIARLSAARPHAQTLMSLGCHHLGDLRALPRGGVARRFGAGLLDALDRAYGSVPDAFEWITLPERFDESLECPAAVELGPGLLFGVQRLLQRLHAWLVARHRGATTLTLHWRHDTLRRSEVADGALTVRTAEPTQDTTHLQRLLAEHLARTPLAAPVRGLRLEADGTEPLVVRSTSLLPEAHARGEPLHRFIERVSARLGAQAVLRPQLVADHRPERQVAWQAATEAASPQQPPQLPDTLAWHPPWLLREPLRLTVRQERPQYQGELTLLAGPERLESGWWPEGHGMDEADGQTRLRDYYLAESPRAGLLWVFRLRGTDRPAWFLHGIHG